MRKIDFRAFVFILLLIDAPVFAMDFFSSLKVYQQERDEKEDSDRLPLAKIAAARSKNPDVIGVAVWDVVHYSSSRRDNLAAIELLNSVLKRIPDESDAYRESVLAKAKLLARVRQKDTADALFQEVIKKHWKNALQRYSESLIECGYLDEACLLEFNRIAGLLPYRYYRGKDDSLENFLSLLRRIKRDNPNRSAVSVVYDSIQRVEESDPCKIVAKALCLSEDGQADQGITLLTGLDEKLMKSNRHTPKNLRYIIQYKNHRESQNIPLYAASILYGQGRDYARAQELFSVYMQRNKGKNKKIAASSLRLANDLILDEKCENAGKFVGFICQSEWYNDKKVLKGLSRDEIASLCKFRQIE